MRNLFWRYLWVLLTFLNAEARAVTYYAAANGSSVVGSYAQPWSVDFAVGKVPNSILQPGDTVIFKDGTYSCTENNTVYSIGHVLEFHISGTPQAKITYKPEHLWEFSFDGGLLFTQSVSNIVLQGFRIFYSGSTVRTRTDILTHPAGVTIYGEGIDVLHNLIENTGHPGIGSWKSTKGKYIAGNIIRFTGFSDFTGSYNGAERGSGMYLQNQDDSSEALIEGNISYFNYTTGLKAYGNTDIWGFKFRHQICVENNEAGIFYHLDNYPSQGVQFLENFIWNGRPGIRVGYPLGNGGHENAVIDSNYVVDDYKTFYLVDGWSKVKVTNNHGVNLSPTGLLWQLEVFGETSGDVASHQMSGNTYASPPETSKVFAVNEASGDFQSWQQRTTQDISSTWMNQLPGTLQAYAFSPSRDPDFVHVAVFNWPTAATTTVNLSNFFSPGDRLAIYDVQALPQAYTTIDYANAGVTLDLTRTQIAPMLGEFPGRTWSGFDTRFRAFVLHRIARSATLPSAPVQLRVVGP